jgi:molybdate transport system ATP-binding protein
VSLLAIKDLRFAVGDFTLEADFTSTHPVTGVFGPSGAGKTTLLELIAGLRKPARGTIRVGENVLYDSTSRVALPPEHRHVAYLPQDLALFPHLTVRENLLYGRGGDQAELDHVVREFGLESLLARPPARLSGGERQRVAIGRALVTRPRLLLLDEPLSNLDRELKERGLELFRRVRDHFGTPIIYVAHDPDEIVELCDEVIVLRRGKIEKQGAPREIFRPSLKPNWELGV